MNLLHGTTRRRTEHILAHGPDPRFREPGGLATEDGFSMYLNYGPFLFGDPDEYARVCVWIVGDFSEIAVSVRFVRLTPKMFTRCTY